MPTYQYKVKDKSGKIIEDIANATNKAVLINDLIQKGFEIISVEIYTEPIYSSEAEFFRSISLHELAKFARHFAYLIKGNIPMVECLELLSYETKNKTFKNVILNLKEQVESGKSLYMALNEHRKHFPKIFIDLVKIGELTGKLYECFVRITNYLEKTIEFRRKIREALTYPTFLFFFILVLLSYIITILIPRFEEIYKSLKGELPIPTQLLLKIGNFLNTNFWIIIGSIFLIMIIYQEAKNTYYGKKFIDKIKVKLPILSPLVIQYNIAHFVKSTSLMFFSGYTFLNSLKEAVSTVENIILSEDLKLVCERIENGQTIFEAFRKSNYVPTFTISMLKVGERSNNLYEMLENIANFNEQELNYVTNTFLKTLEPMLIISLALVVGLVLFAAYLPVLSMSQLIKM